MADMSYQRSDASRSSQPVSDEYPLPIKGGDRRISTATIANGESLSGAVDLGSASLVAIQMPASWTAASLTFQVSYDCATYADVKDELGTEFTVTAAASLVIASAAIAATFLGARYLKVRSGTSGVPVNQGAARDIKIIAVA